MLPSTPSTPSAPAHGGDTGRTALATGRRVPKTDARIEALGALDELNSHLGLLRAQLPPEAAADEALLVHVQRMLFALGAAVAGAADATQPTADDLHRLDDAAAQASNGVPQGGGFILPGGTPAAARAHVCRTVCRRAERRLWALRPQPLAPTALAYVNRLSTFLFALARKLQHQAGREETFL